MAVQAAAVPAAAIYVGGAALAYGFMYATNPEFRRAHDSMGEAMAEGLSDATDNLSDLIFGEDEAVPAPATGTATDAATDTASDTSRCPLLPYIHYTDAGGLSQIMSTRMFLPGLGGGVYLTNVFFGPVTVWMVIFIGNPLYVNKSKFYVRLMADCTVPITLAGSASSIMPEYFHPGTLRERPPHMQILFGGANGFPEHPDFQGLSLP